LNPSFVSSRACSGAPSNHALQPTLTDEKISTWQLQY
jgi:hypothetical protein